MILLELKMIKVLQVFGGLDRGGSETMIMNLYRNINRSEIQFDFVKHVSKKCAYEDEILTLGGKIYTAPNYNFINHFSYCKWWKKFFTEHPEYKIIHGHYFTLASVFFKIAHKFNRATIGHSHISKFKITSLKKLLSRLYLLKLAKHSDYCFACSQNAGEWIFGKRPFTVIKNAIDTQKFTYSDENRKKIRDEFNLQGKFVLGNIGRLTIQKNQEFLIDVFAEVHKQNSNSALLIVGVGQLEQKLKEKVKSLGLLDSVIFTGSRGDVPALLSAMDVFVFPSLWEGLGIVAIEAQTSGLRTICSDTVPRDAQVTNLVDFVSLNKSAEEWADSVLKYSCSYERLNMQQDIVNAGYDVLTTVKWLQNFYLSI